MKFSFSFFLTSVLAFILLSSCYQRIEGCLDQIAVNYDVTSDDSCKDCCVYPDITLNMVSLYKKDTISFSDTLENSRRQKFRIIDVRFYLSQLVLEQSGTEFEGLEKLVTAQGTTVQDRTFLYRSSQPNTTLGSMQLYGETQKASVNLGMDSTLFYNAYLNLPSSHPFSSSNHLRSNSGQLSKIIIRYLIIGENLISELSLAGDNVPVILNPKQSKITRRGENLQYHLNPDYSHIFHDVDIYDQALLKQKLNDNLQILFSN